MLRIKIRSFRDAEGNIHAATNKYFFRDGNEAVKKNTRWLEPEEVIELEDEEALKLLATSGQYIEQTLDVPTRPISFNSAIEAEESSMFAPKVPGRADQAREEMEQVKAEMVEKEAKERAAEIEKIRAEEREKIREEIRAEEVAKMREEQEAAETPMPNGHALPSENVEEVQEEEPAPEPAPQRSRRRNRG